MPVTFYGNWSFEVVGNVGGFPNVRLSPDPSPAMGSSPVRSGPKSHRSTARRGPSRSNAAKTGVRRGRKISRTRCQA
jgi:hypothetical protein